MEWSIFFLLSGRERGTTKFWNGVGSMT